MEFRQIQYFLCLYEEGSVTRAARRLNIVQPALSMQIAKLEEELGRPLFVRNPQGMEPTSEGRRMYRLFTPVMAEFARAKEQVMQSGGELTGQVRVGTIATIAEGVLGDAVMAFCAIHSKVALALTDGFSGTLIDAVSGGQLDAAIVNKPRRPLALNVEPLADEEVLLLSSRSASLLAGTLPFARVSGMKLVLPTRQHGLRGILESFAQAEDVSLEPVLEIDSISAIVKLVRQSDFCTLLPRLAVHREIETGALQAHRINRPRLVRQIVCVTHPRRTPSPATAAFLSALRQQIQQAVQPIRKADVKTST